METESLPKSILLVEDNLDSAEIMKTVLSSQGHMVEHADSVASAIAICADRTFDLLVCDLGLPDGSGHEVVAALQKGKKIKRAIALSGYGMEKDIERGKEAGFDKHLIKPIDLDELEAAIAN